MTRPSAADPLLILAMDHRASFAKQFGVDGEPSAEQHAAMQAAKLLIYRGVQNAHSLLESGHAGVLVDEELGADVLRTAHADGLTLAMPVEKSGQKLFALQYGAATEQHIETFDPTYVKVLVRMNPDDPADATRAQLTELATLSDLLQRLGRGFIYELLVAATDAQLASAGDQATYDRDVRPDLVARVIAANYAAGVEPTLWKIEGLDTVDAARQVVAAAKAGGRDTDCIVLGRDAPQAVLDHWLSVAAPVAGFVGFAVGRSIWEDALDGYLHDRDDAAFVDTVSQNYLHYARTYLAAR